MAPILWIGLAWFKAAKPLQGSSLAQYDSNIIFWPYMIPIQFVKKSQLSAFLLWKDVGRWDVACRGFFLSDISKSRFSFFNLAFRIFITLSVDLYIYIFILHFSTYQYQVNKFLFIKHKNAHIYCLESCFS